MFRLQAKGSNNYTYFHNNGKYYMGSNHPTQVMVSLNMKAHTILFKGQTDVQWLIKICRIVPLL